MRYFVWNKWFTLVEILVWVMLSTTLMISVSLFITNWIKNISDQQKILDNTEEELDFFMELQGVLKRMNSTWSIVWSWYLFPINTQYDSWGYAYIWIKSFSWYICNEDNWLDLEDDEFLTNHLYLKKEFPYEGSRVSDNGFYTEEWGHYVKNWSWDIVIWKEIFWDKLVDWWKWKDAYLNNPTGIVWVWNHLFISDTFNNRVLYYNKLTELIYILLDNSDWLFLPSWLALNYDDVNNTRELYISNTWKWEVLKYNWGSKISKNLDINFKIPKTINDVEKLSLEFIWWVTWVNNPDNISDFIFNWISKNTWWDYLTWSTNRIDYYFSDFSSLYSSQTNIAISNCSVGSRIYLDWDKLKKDQTICSDTHTWSILTYVWTTWSYSDIGQWSDLRIRVSDIDITTTTSTWSIYTKLDIEWNNSFEELFPLFTLWDNKILTKDDNSLSIFSTVFTYPTWLEYNILWNWNHEITINDYKDRKKYIYNITTWSSNDQNLSAYDYESINNESDYLLDVPIKDIKFNDDNWILTIVVEYYKKYSCTDPRERILRTMIFKKSFKK